MSKWDYDYSLIQCPKCFQGKLAILNEYLICESCNERFPFIDGIPFLVSDPKVKTKLIVEDYDKTHQINPDKYNYFYKRWEPLISSYQVERTKLLELGCGTGLLSYSLVSKSNFNEIHISDISSEMILRTLHVLAQKNKGKLFPYICDANNPPFMDGAFDIVVGNSVLHHFLDYTDTIRNCFRILKQNGVAIFSEPILNSKIIIAFLVKLIVSLTENGFQSDITEQDIDKLKKALRH